LSNESEMLVDERRHLIAESVIAQGAATVAELSDRFRVSQVTIRSDLEALEKQRTLTRNRGGAVANRISRFTPAFQQQSSVNRKAKEAIAGTAATLVQDGDRVILDAGSTTLYLADLLSHRRLTIAVNSVYSMNKLVDAPSVELILIGGTLYRPALSFTGELAEGFLDRLHFDKAILGVNGVTAHGISVNNPQEAGIKRKMLERADCVVVLADSSKIDIESLVRIEPLDRVDVLVTETPIPKAAAKRLKNAHPKLEVLIA
jgi:DeoR/GlpR family transcriptional regulator of sugar metabolism